MLVASSEIMSHRTWVLDRDSIGWHRGVRRLHSYVLNASCSLASERMLRLQKTILAKLLVSLSHHILSSCA